VLWQRGPSSLGQVCEELRSERPVATTTVATMLGVMLEKALVRRKRAERSYEWSAAVTQAATARSMVGKLVDGIFDGSASQLVAHLVETGNLSADELKELRQLIDSTRGSGSRKGIRQAQPSGAKAQRKSS
jgi:predicted transcriptional regulator